MNEIRLIDANAAADKIIHDISIHEDELGAGIIAIVKAVATALHDEEDFPTIKAETLQCGRCMFLEQKHGYLWKCSNCNGNFDQRFKYCPYCGARMDGGADNG